MAGPVSLREIVLELRSSRNVGKAAYRLRRGTNALRVRLKHHGLPGPAEIIDMDEGEVRALLDRIDSMPSGMTAAQRKARVRDAGPKAPRRRVTASPEPAQDEKRAPDCSPVEAAVIEAGGSYSALAEIAVAHGLSQTRVLQMHHRLRAAGGDV